MQSSLLLAIMLPTVHTLARFEQAKEQFKQQMCHNVDTLFNIFVSELNSNQQLTTSSNTTFTNDALQRILDTVTLQKSSTNHHTVEHVQQQQQQQHCLNANESLTGTDQIARVPLADDQPQHNVPLVPVNERVPEVNLNPETVQINQQNLTQTSDPLVQNNLPPPPQQQQSHSALFSIKQEITDEDELLNETQYYNNMNENDTNWEESAHDDQSIDDNLQQKYMPGCQCDSCPSGVINHEEAYNDSTNVQNQPTHNSFDRSHDFVVPNSAPCSYSMTDDEEIYDEELLREVKEEILEEQRINAMKQKNDSNECDGIDTQVSISTDQLTDDADQIIDSSSNCTSTQPISTSPTLLTLSISNDSSVQSYEQIKITNCQIEENTESNALEDGELIDSDVDEHFNEFDIPKKPSNNKCRNRESNNAIRFNTSVGKNRVPDKANISPSLSNHNIPLFDYDKIFRVISEKCPSCGFPFGTKEELNGHMFQEHNMLPFVCPFPACNISGRSFLTRTELTKHFHHKNLNHCQMICTQCSRKCDSPLELFTHTSDHHRQGKFACVKDNCKNVARFRGSAIKHYIREHLDKVAMTKLFARGDNMCKERLSLVIQPDVRSPKRKKPSVDEEDTAHSKRKAAFSVISLKCTEKECHSEFSTEIELANHLKIEHWILSCVCPIERCRMSFKTRSELIIHSEVVHQDMLKFKCANCDFFYYNFMLLYRHNFANHNEGKFRCGNDKCDYIGKSRNDTTKHYIYSHVNGKRGVGPL